MSAAKGTDQTADDGSVELIPGMFGRDDDGRPVSLQGRECERCGVRSYPPRRSCLACRSLELRAVDLGKTGVVYSFGRADMAMPGFEPGHLFGMVELDSGLLIYAQLEGATYDELAVGDRVELVVGAVRRDAEGRGVLGPRFRPARHGRMTAP